MDFTYVNNTYKPTFSKLDDTITINLNWYNNTKRNYYFQSSVDKYHEIIELYGLPEIIKYDIGGFCSWFNCDFYEKITLYDSIKINKFPIKHNNILCLEIFLPITMEKWQNIELLCSNISYNHSSKILYVNCPTISFGNAIISLIIDYINNKISWNEIKNKPILLNKLKFKRLTNIKEQDNDINNIKLFISNKITKFNI